MLAFRLFKFFFHKIKNKILPSFLFLSSSFPSSLPFFLLDRCECRCAHALSHTGWSEDSFGVVFHLPPCLRLGTLGLQKPAAASSFYTWGLEIWTQELRVASQTLYPLSHLCSPQIFKPLRLFLTSKKHQTNSSQLPHGDRMHCSS